MSEDAKDDYEEARSIEDYNDVVFWNNKHPPGAVVWLSMDGLGFDLPRRGVTETRSFISNGIACVRIKRIDMDVPLSACVPVSEVSIDQRIADEWNENTPIGTAVMHHPVGFREAILLLRTRSSAFVCRDTAIVFVEGKQIGVPVHEFVGHATAGEIESHTDQKRRSR